MIKDIQELNFPSYATLSSATVTLNDMGDRTISTQVKIDGSIVPDFSYDWEVEFKGERYIQPLRQPQASKGNESMRSTIDLVFYHKTIWQLKRYYFVEMTSTMSGTAIADQYIASLGLNLSDFCVAFQKVLDHYFDSEISIDLNPNLDYTKGVQFMSISYSYIWDVLQKMYEVYGVRWHIEGNTIKVGYPSPILSHTFQYGYEGGLLQVERQVQDANIRNSLLGRGGEQNLPAYYFKEAPEGSLFASDPDAIPELANIYFSNLRGKTFRDYVKGWKAKHYGGAPMSEPTEAYTKGYTDTKFSPIEYVEDKDSIKKYGLLQGALDNNEDIYPSIQGAPNGEDVVVYVEPVTSDDVEQSVKKEGVITNIDPVYVTIAMQDHQTSGRHKLSIDFEVPEGKIGFLSYDLVLLDGVNKGNDITDNIKFLHKEFSVQNLDTYEKVDATYYSAGKYRYTIDFTLTSEIGKPNFSGTIKATVGIEQGYIEVFDSTDNSDKWLPTFNIWVKNIWHSTRNEGENDLEYAERVWRPILGDRQGNEAKVVFSSGWLSGHEDYEFTIVDFAYDNSHEDSEWRLTLAKSDAELEATGKYIPSASTNGQAYAGDTFFFIGIDMPHQYVLWAEERLDNYKTSSLNEVSEIQPKWVVRFDKLRLHEGEDNLAEQIVVGGAINLADVRFIDAPALQLYLQSVTYTWSEHTLLYPDIEVVLADTIVPVQNPVAQLQGNIDAINSQLHSIGNIAQVVRKIGDSLYLRKDGVADVSKSPTKFVGNVSGNNFRQGKVGGADWGIYRDENGNAIAEFDKIIARKDLEVNNLIINQVSYVGGMQITSAASLTIARVIEVDNAYQCFFDQKGGSIANLFQVNDIAYSQRFDEDNNTTKYYKRKVVAVDIDSITLSKSQADGDGVPMANDVVIQYGNTTDTNRQYVIIRDVIGGGYERMLSDLNSVSSQGVEYYFAGRMQGDTPRWFVGNNNQFIEYKDGHLQINADVTIGANSDLSASQEFQNVKQTANQAKQDAQNAEASAKSYADELVKDLQNQLDAKVESYFFDYDPTTSNIPASEWTTDELKADHLNDTFTNTQSGQSWRWLLKDGVYQWVEITDTQSAEALAKAQEALGVANGKVAVFVEEPRSPYNAKDLWLQGEDGRIKRCTTTRTTTGEFHAEDWVNADDSHEYAEGILAQYKQSVDATVDSLNKAIEDAEKASKTYTDEGKQALQASINALNLAKANATDVYTKAEADGKIDKAEEDAIKAAEDLANAARELAEATAQAYADGVVDEEEKARLAQAEQNLKDAKAYAEHKANDAENNAKSYADGKVATIDYLKEAFPLGAILDVNGVTLAALMGVKNQSEDVVAGLYGGASEALNTKGYYDATHGAMLLFGGINNVDDPTSYTTAIFQDGFIESKTFATARSGKRIVIEENTLRVYGDDARQSVLEIAYDEAGKPYLGYYDVSTGEDRWYLSESGISTSYTVAQVDDILKQYMLLSTPQEVGAKHNFTNGLKIGGIELRKTEDGNIYLDGNLVLSGGVTMYGADDTPSASLFDALPIDGVTIKWLNGKLTAMGGGGDVNIEGITLEDVEAYLEDNNYITRDALAPYATSNSVSALLGNYLPLSSFTKATIKSTLGISDWALASAKPTYTAVEVGALGVNDTAQSALKMTPEWLTDLNSATPWRFFDMNSGYGSTDGNKPNPSWVSGMTGRVAGSSIYRWQLAMTSEVNHPYFRKEMNGIWSNWSLLAFTSDIPTKLSQLTDDVVAGKYLPIGGTAADSSKFGGMLPRYYLSAPSGDFTDFNGEHWNTIYEYRKGDGLSYDNDPLGIGWAAFISLRSNKGTDGLQFLAQELAGANKLLFRCKPRRSDVGQSNKWSEVASLDSNVASANKLATPRTIWGQSFDGTGDVDGSLAKVSQIVSIIPDGGTSPLWRITSYNTTSMLIQASASDGLSKKGRIGIQGYDGEYLSSVYVNSDEVVFSSTVKCGGHLVGSETMVDWSIKKGEQNIIRAANAGTIITPYDKTNGFIALRTGNDTIVDGSKEIRLLSNGYVGFGTSSPTERVDINGNLKVGGTIKLGKFSKVLEYAQGEYIDQYGNPHLINNALPHYWGVFGMDSKAILSVHGNGFVGIGTTTPSAKVDVNGSAKIGGDLTLNGGILSYTNGVWTLNGDLLVTGGVTQFAQGVKTASSIMDAIVVDGTTITKQNGKLVAIGGGGSASSIDWSGINNKPTTLAGYGIADAYTKNEVNEAITIEVVEKTRDFYTRSEAREIFALKASLDDKQNTLFSGVNIKTINGQSVLGEGNIEISGAGGGVAYVTLDVSKLTTNNSFYITESKLSSIKMSRNGNAVIVKDTNSTTADSEWGQVISCYRQYAGSSVYTYRVSILHKDNTPLSGADNAKLYNVDIMDSPQSSGYYCIVTSINNLY